MYRSFFSCCLFTMTTLKMPRDIYENRVSMQFFSDKSTLKNHKKFCFVLKH